MTLDISYTSRNIGDVFYTLRKDETLNGAVPCDGSEYSLTDFESDSNQNNLFTLITNSMIPVLNYVDYALQIKSYGSCAYFAYDESTGKFKVPTIRNVYVQAGDNATLAKYLAPCIPNIVGQVGGFWREPDTPTGAFKTTSSGSGNRPAGTHFSVSMIRFNAADSSPIYKDNCNTVQPPSIILRPMVQLVSAPEGSFDGGDPEEPIPSLKIPYVFVPGTEAKATEVNANFSYVLNVISTLLSQKENISSVSTMSLTNSDVLDLIESEKGYLSINQNPPISDSSNKIATTNWVNEKLTAIEEGDVFNWVQLSNGLIFQYGTIDFVSTGNWLWFNFPTAFPSKCFNVTVSLIDSQLKDFKYSIKYTNEKFGLLSSLNSGSLSYIAIGC